MKACLQTLLFFQFLVVSLSAWAQSLGPQARVSHSAVYKHYRKFLHSGVPSQALDQVLQYIEANNAKAISVTRKNRQGHLELETVPFIVKAQYAAVIDYSLPSTAKRFYLMNLSTGDTQKFYVSHGERSGVRYSTEFSNTPDSLMSSLGLALTGEIYFGFHNKSMSLHGLSPSNGNLDTRDIVLHSADYAAEDFIQKQGRLGRSWGCAAVDPAALDTITASLGVGSVILFYHRSLMAAAVQSPDHQWHTDHHLKDDPDVVLSGEEADLQSKRMLSPSSPQPN